MQPLMHQPQHQQATYMGNANIMTPTMPRYAGEGNPFGGHAAYMPPQSQLAPQGNKSTTGGKPAHPRQIGPLSNCSLGIAYVKYDEEEFLIAVTFNTFLGVYMANAQLEGYNVGATRTPFTASNLVPSTRTEQANASEWDPFGPGSGPVPAVASVAAETGRTENKKWDPFAEEEYKATGPSGGGGANDAWADIQDSQVGGKTGRVKDTRCGLPLLICGGK